MSEREETETADTWTSGWSAKTRHPSSGPPGQQTTGVQLTVISLSKQISVSTGQGGSYQDTFQAPDNDSRNAVI